MKLSHVAVAALALSLAAALAVQGQEKAPPGGRIGVVNLRDCLDKTKNQWIADIDLELQRLQEADSGRATDLNPQERLRIRTKNLDAGNRRRLEVYTEIVRLSSLLAKERGFDVVQRIDRMPTLESGDADLMGQIDRRAIVHFDPSIDLTASVLEQLNKGYAARKK
jgi:Skp family chaperone for outer membrane proteins